MNTEIEYPLTFQIMNSDGPLFQRSAIPTLYTDLFSV